MSSFESHLLERKVQLFPKSRHRRCRTVWLCRDHCKRRIPGPRVYLTCHRLFKGFRRTLIKYSQVKNSPIGGTCISRRKKRFALVIATRPCEELFVVLSFALRQLPQLACPIFQPSFLGCLVAFHCLDISLRKSMVQNLEVTMDVISATSRFFTTLGAYSTRL